jgi:AcrR family transcriptional regulator
VQLLPNEKHLTSEINLADVSTLTKEQSEDLVGRGRGRPRDEVTKSRILEAALELVGKHSFADVTAEAIAERAGASKATVYRWWPNKAAVLLEALREAVAQELPYPHTGDLRQDLRVQLRNFIKVFAGRRGRTFKAFIAAAQTDAQVAKTFEMVWRRPIRAAARAVLENHRGNSLQENTDLDLVMDALYGPLYYQLLVGQLPLSEKYADALTDFVIAAITNKDRVFR